MLTVDDIKITLPYFPNEVIESWLLPFGLKIGWPPYPQHSQDPTFRWKYILGRKELSYWNSLRWEKVESAIDWDGLDPLTVSTVFGILDGSGFFQMMSDNKERIGSVVKSIKDHGTFPVPPVFVNRRGLLHVVDGNYRLAALAVYEKMLEKYALPPLDEKHMYWVGRVME